jgi:hypothetical protein
VDLTIKTPSDLRLLRTRGHDWIHLELDHPRRAEWEAELNAHYHACGCDAGQKAMLAGLAISAVLIIWRYAKDSWLEAGGIALAVTVACGIAGKTIGIVRARRKLARTIRAIEEAWR